MRVGCKQPITILDEFVKENECLAGVRRVTFEWVMAGYVHVLVEISM